MKYTYGGGLRFNINKRDALNLRMDYTFTSFGGQGLSLGVGKRSRGGTRPVPVGKLKPPCLSGFTSATYDAGLGPARPIS